ncbi:RsfA family transcriptional regulator [Geobacillus proteiniphilus]|uniref:Prespore specific transcriptional activator RsfA n=2 Tax=Anoxybacillaceae TaxID=3120669 RepID=A0A1Q5T1A0_9BACL|nr:MULTISPECIES: RsfA family transcriptional regulator [Geobacillus]MED4972643.1 RsfA family transcriptional regulator [Geobacillus thermoleovorans]OKO94014.1 Prespore specific transcriptional activator RsfA [Geobacillus proteiniphilus]OPX04614.1 RsfA family transcriptional regulator [Geobacillus sp. LEMMY01]QCK82428.1 RsfA family transcriptional regulator [Geobacillus kaustophilus NBRC 102445]WMJ17983.1 RsfA family transcriptional regulator [Geobacillus proteiniphilus]
MTGVRQDAWTKEEDELLANVVLQYIREGGTQLEAFAEVGRRLSRTAAACGFRWNSCVRKQYKEEIEQAKQERKMRKKETASAKESEGQAKVETAVKSHLSWAEVLAFLQAEEQKARDARRTADENRALKNDMEQLQQMVTKLQMEKEALQKQLAAIQEEYKTLLSIMERARKMVADSGKPAPNAAAEGVGEG